MGRRTCTARFTRCRTCAPRAAIRPARFAGSFRCCADWSRTASPDYFGVVFDAPGKTFRDEWYPEYKANRRTDARRSGVRQIAPLHELIRAHGWPLDHGRGRRGRRRHRHTRSRRAEAQQIDSIVSTGDKDLAQLISPRITLVNTMSNEILDERTVVAKFGVRADQVLDLLTLTGDAVDNVPGVPKVGPKTAAKWLAQYGSRWTTSSRMRRNRRRGRRESARMTLDMAAARQEAADGQDRLRASDRADRPRVQPDGSGEAQGTLRALRIQDLGQGPRCQRRGGRVEAGASTAAQQPAAAAAAAACLRPRAARSPAQLRDGDRRSCVSNAGSRR